MSCGEAAFIGMPRLRLRRKTHVFSSVFSVSSVVNLPCLEREIGFELGLDWLCRRLLSLIYLI